MMATLCFLSVFIGYAYSKNIYCYNASECAGDIDIGSNSDDKVYGFGYKSLFQSTSSNTYSRYCFGALSCKETRYIDTYKLHCYGAYSCSNSAYIKAANYIFGYGANSLMNTNISAKGTISCGGDKSCAYSTISSSTNGASSRLDANGALSLFAATINIISGTFSAYFDGYYAGYQATIHCEAGSVCNIHCYYNGCGGLSVICDGNAQCNIINESVFSLPPNTGLKLNRKEILFWNSTQITTRNEDECSKQKSDKTFDKTDYNEKDLIYTTNVGPICCRADQACSGSLISYDSNGASVVCSGYNSYTEIISNSTDLMVECSAVDACSHIAGNGGTAYCYGRGSCWFATITKMSHIYCTGSSSCGRAIITSSGINITVYLTGSGSGYFASITCNESDHCTILCDAYKACEDMSLCCRGTCFVECNQDTECPQLVCGTNPTPNPIPNSTTNPTTFPIFDPTLKSAKTTANPTVNPTFNVTTKQRVNTETITIIAVAVCAFLGAFFGTICVFLCMNKRRNAKLLNAVELEGVEGEDSMEMTTKNGAYSIINNAFDGENVNLTVREIGTDNNYKE